MEKLPIVSRKEFDNVVGVVGNYVCNWLQKELIVRNRLDFVVRKLDQNIFSIGDLLLGQIESKQWIVAHSEDNYVIFRDRITAVIYCIFWTHNELAQARHLQELDRQLTFLESDLEYYLYKIKKSKKDTEKFSIALSRYKENHYRINIVKQQIKKIISIAKYKKIRKSYELDRN